MSEILELLLENPAIITGIMAFTLFVTIVAVLKKVAKIGLIILAVILILTAIGGATIQNKYALVYENNILTATFLSKEIKIDFDKIAGAKIEAQETEKGVKVLVSYKNGEKDEIIVPNFIYYLIKYKSTPAKLSF